MEETKEETKEIPQENNKVIKSASEDLNKLKEINDEIEQELLRKEELRARTKFLGEAEAGNTPQKTEEEIKKEGAKEFFKGSEIEKAIERHG